MSRKGVSLPNLNLEIHRTVSVAQLRSGSYCFSYKLFCRGDCLVQTASPSHCRGNPSGKTAARSMSRVAVNSRTAKPCNFAVRIKEVGNGFNLLRTYTARLQVPTLYQHCLRSHIGELYSG